MSSIFVDEVLPTAADLEFYHDKGWLLTNLYVREECLARCAEALEEIYAGKYDAVYSWSRHKAVQGFGELYEDRTQPRMDSYVSHHKSALKEVLRAPHLAHYAASLMGAAEVRLWRDVVLTMPARSSGHTGLHVDKNYWSTTSSEKLTSAWFSLDDSDAASGCLVMGSGSHRWRAHPVVRKVGIDDLEGVCQLYKVRPEAVSLQIVPHRRGQVSFHSCRVLHGSVPNRSDRLRQSLVVAFQDGESRYVAPSTADELRLSAFSLGDYIGPRKDGVPDHAAEELYPVLYRADERSVNAAYAA